MNDANIEVYWRPGCPDCMYLRRGLSKLGIETLERNIWADPSAREYVRKVASGNETVPTVAIGDTNLINPTVEDVIEVIRQLIPGLLIKGSDSTPDNDGRRAISQWIVIAILVALSFYVEKLGFTSYGWGVDVVSVLFWISFRTFRSRKRIKNHASS
ncbi:glutaredoxin domain-containing protein [Acidithrix ferrooxidans]|uniref:Glutaredoxin n=1 Tax=Acidithrix ferrooxidans TaxID=1280514 RepID=A0A0D8HKH7_9ACTN|nr:glutaredoxin domain-containing protein [Acidithrix ferrooxidans]KJF17611.1 glutaredoxin [Acidithrix ferrooxidans]